jgi:hypothetical protein
MLGYCKILDTDVNDIYIYIINRKRTKLESMRECQENDFFKKKIRNA